MSLGNRHKHKGFTLIELMVVLVIVGIASAAISLSIKPDPLQLLRKDAQRLAQLLEVAQSEARADGRPITWLADAKGYRFSRALDSGEGRDTFSTDELLRPRAWQTPALQVQLEPRRRLVLDAEWLGEPVLISLSDGTHKIALARNAAGKVQVQ